MLRNIFLFLHVKKIFPIYYERQINIKSEQKYHRER
jgi:hypothetical protein